MKHYETTAQFYKSDDWTHCKNQVLQERMKDGVIYCELCGEPILKSLNLKANNNSKAIVFHHKIYLNNFNVNDSSISIAPSNIMILHWQCHNLIHNRFSGQSTTIEKKVYLITGPSCSGKTSFVKERLQPNDLVLDIDDIWEMISGQPRYIKPNALKPLVFKIRDEIKDSIAKGLGTWRNAFIIESLPNKMDREREANKYRAFNVEVITMEASQEECLNRLHQSPNGRDINAYEKYIDDYFKRYIE